MRFSKGLVLFLAASLLIVTFAVSQGGPEILGNQVLYINHYLKDYDMPDHMDSANNTIVQQKALDIGKRWYTLHREQIRTLLQAR